MAYYVMFNHSAKKTCTYGADTMNNTKWLKQVKTIAFILVGAAIFSFGIIFFIIPNQLMEGGVTGISLLLNYTFHVSPALTILTLNIPLFIVGSKFLGVRYMFYTGIGIAGVCFFLNIFKKLVNLGWITPLEGEQDMLLICLYAGVTLGAGIGIVFRYGGTTGGADILARMMNQKYNLSMGRAMFFIDFIVIATSSFYIPKEKIMYTLVVIFISSRVIDFIQEGAYCARSVTIISDKTSTIATLITANLQRGVTLIPAIGGYSKKNKTMAYCVIYRQELKQIKQLIHAVDPRAFIITSEVHDVHGEGFGNA